MTCKILAVIMVLASAAMAQTSTVTATITDPDGQTWNNGNVQIIFIPAVGAGSSSTWSGGPPFPQKFTTTMNSSGTFTVAIPDNNFITPRGSSWQFTLCSNTSAPCQNVVTTATGTSPNLSAPLSAQIIAPRFGGGPFAYGYLDGEVINPTTGVEYFNVTSQQQRQWNGSAWISVSGSGSPGTPLGSVQGNNAGVFTGIPGSSVNFATGQVNIQPPSSGGTNIQPSVDIGTFGAANYAAAFNWTQSPTIPATISVGSNTVTINAVRGITAFSAVSPGISGFYTKHYLYLAGTGTAEAVLLTATTCTGASTGTCTVTFTAANTHSAGYTLASATAGYQEAYIDAFGAARAQTLANSPGQGIIGGVKVVGRSTDFPLFNAPFYIDSTGGEQAPIIIDFGGTTVACNTSGTDCLRYGSGVGNGAAGPENALIENGTFIVSSNSFVRTANGTSIAVHDHGQNLQLENISFEQWPTQSASAVFDYLVVVDGDQNVDIGWMNPNVGIGPPLKCDTTFCGAAVLGTTLNSAAHGTIHNSQMTMDCTGAIFDWQSGNGLTIHDNIFQDWPIFPWRYGGGLVDLTDTGGNYYEGICTNPELGYSAGTGPQYFGNHAFVENAFSPGFPAATTFTQFSNTGSTVYVYYVVGINGSAQQTVPMMLGTASTNGSTNYTMKWPDFGATTYTVLRDGPLALDGTDTAPFGTANWQVGSGITCSGTPHICSFTETFGATSSFTVNPAYVPTLGTADQTLRYWPVPLFIGTGNASACVLYVGIAVAPVNDCLFSGAGQYYTAIFTGPGVSGGNNIAINGANSITGVRAWKPGSMQSTSLSGKAPTGAMILPPAQPNQLLTGFKGPINFSTLWAMTSHDTCLITSFDSNFAKTLNAGPSHQPTLDTGDNCQGFDTSPSWSSWMSQSGFTWYLNHPFDSGTSRQMKLTTSGLELAAHLNQKATADFAGSCAMSTSTSCTFTLGASYTSTALCVTSPVTTVSGSIVAGACSVSGTTVTITAAASNSLTWNAVLIGNPN